MATKMTKAQERQFQPYTTRPSKLWECRAVRGNKSNAYGSVEMNDPIPFGGEVVGYTRPLEGGGFKVEWV